MQPFGHAAQRIAIELKGKALFSGDFIPAAPIAKAAVPSVAGDAVAALIGLGVAEQQARVAVDAALKAAGEGAELPALIRASLKALGK